MSLTCSGTSWLGSIATILGLYALSPAFAGECPREIAAATKIILVVAENDNSLKARIETFERATLSNKFQRKLAASPAVIGQNGLAWGWPFRGNAGAGEAVKVEGDGRTPAGIYRLGNAFGFERKDLRDYLTLEVGKTFCVDEPRSQHYNEIVARSDVPPGTTGEDMRSVPSYRNGIIIEYASNAVARAGSCIFIHIWRTPNRGTAGCVAAEEKTVLELQRWGHEEGAHVAIYSKRHAAKFVKCLGL